MIVKKGADEVGRQNKLLQINNIKLCVPMNISLLREEELKNRSASFIIRLGIYKVLKRISTLN